MIMPFVLPEAVAPLEFDAVAPLEFDSVALDAIDRASVGTVRADKVHISFAWGSNPTRSV
jgi:hypothetical protein